jgi:hypothetical protein
MTCRFLRFYLLVKPSGVQLDSEVRLDLVNFVNPPLVPPARERRCQPDINDPLRR